MKEKWKEMSGSRRVLLMVLAALAAGFTLIYLILGFRRGIWYQKSFLSRTEREGNTLYAGNVQGRDTTFTVTPAGQVTLRVNEETYGPFTVTEHGTVTSGQSVYHRVTLTEGDKVIYEGRFPTDLGDYWLEGETGSIRTGDGTRSGYYGRDLIYGTEGWKEQLYGLTVSLVAEPPVISRVNWAFYLLGLLAIVATAATVIWEDAIYRFELSFRVRDPESVEPSDWELTGRWIGWGSGIGVSLLLFFMGLGW